MFEVEGEGGRKGGTEVGGRKEEVRRIATPNRRGRCRGGGGGELSRAGGRRLKFGEGAGGFTRGYPHTHPPRDVG